MVIFLVAAKDLLYNYELAAEALYIIGSITTITTVAYFCATAAWPTH